MRYSLIGLVAIASMLASVYTFPEVHIPEIPDEREIDVSHVMTWEETRQILHDKCLRDLRDVQREAERVPTTRNWMMWEYYIEKCKKLERKGE